MNLIDMFNAGVDHVRRSKSGAYAPSTLRLATHELICTRWNNNSTHKDLKKRRRENATRPDGFALSVCATPLRGRRIHQFKQVLRTRLDGSSVYRVRGTVEGKRAVLREMAQHCKAPHKMARLINPLSSEKCDEMYFHLLECNRLLTQKQKRKKS